MEDKDYGKFKWFVCDYIDKSMALEDELEIANYFRGTHNKKYFMDWDRRD